MAKIQSQQEREIGYDLTGKNILVTGANKGIGLEVAKGCARRGANVHMLCRSLERGAAARAEVASYQQRLETAGAETASVVATREELKRAFEKHSAADSVNANVMSSGGS